MKNIRNSLNALCILRDILQFPPIENLLLLLNSLEEGDPAAQARAAGSYAAALLPYEGALDQAVFSYLEDHPNAYSAHHLRGEACGDLEAMLRAELDVLEEACAIGPEDVAEQLIYSGYLPRWQSGQPDLQERYDAFLAEVPRRGFGIFRSHTMFLLQDGRVKPVVHPDPVTLADLHGYMRQRRIILRNTALLLAGGRASNVLLYGDSGTGKSSTVKAVASYYAPEGLRLIEVRKSQLHEIPELLSYLSRQPLKFLLFIDDLSFTAEDDNFAALKGILEGSVLSRAENVAIYATSNRRRLIRESFADRGSDDVHANETIQQQTSLSDRFGITLPYMVPKRDAYLQIVAKLAQGTDVPEEELFAGAERYALERGGRSGRVARQYVDQLALRDVQI